MNESTTVKSMNFSAMKPEVSLSIKIAPDFKRIIEQAAAASNMGVSSFVRVAVEEKVKLLIR